MIWISNWASEICLNPYLVWDHCRSMSLNKRDVTPLLTYWSCVSLHEALEMAFRKSVSDPSYLCAKLPWRKCILHWDATGNRNPSTLKTYLPVQCRIAMPANPNEAHTLLFGIDLSHTANTLMVDYPMMSEHHQPRHWQILPEYFGPSTKWVQSYKNLFVPDISFCGPIIEKF